MRRRSQQVSIFNLSMLDVMAGAMGVFLSLTVILLPYYKKDLVQMVQRLKQDLGAAHAQVEAARDSLQDIQAQAATARDSMQALGDALARAETRGDSLAQAIERLGFTISKKAVFVVDVSGSMEGEKIDEVRAGLKMLLASMDSRYEIEIVFFPDDQRGVDYRSWRGQLVPVTQRSKYEAYAFLNSLRADGGTPTGSVMEFVLSKYTDAETVVLLSDGSPCRGSDCDLTLGEIRAIAEEITSLNNYRFTINTIGVGEEFRKINSTDAAVLFLKRLAQENGGFFVGF